MREFKTCTEHEACQVESDGVTRRHHAADPQLDSPVAPEGRRTPSPRRRLRVLGWSLRGVRWAVSQILYALGWLLQQAAVRLPYKFGNILAKGRRKLWKASARVAS